MWAYIARRTFIAILVLWGVVTITFVLTRILPLNPASQMLGPHATPEKIAEIEDKMHLNDPLPKQYVMYLKDLLCGDLGESYVKKRPVAGLIAENLPRTVILALAAILIAVSVGMFVGVVSALKQNTWIDNFGRIFSITSISIPSFVLAIWLSVIFGYHLRWFPLKGYDVGPVMLYYLVLPAVALGTRPMAAITRLTRASMLEVMGQDYIRTARAKGVTEMVVVFVHGLRNALIPVVTAISGSLAALLAGAFFIEMVFAWPGMGKLAIDAIDNSDFPIVMGTVLFAAVIFTIVNLLMDIVYSIIDPRITLR